MVSRWGTIEDDGYVHGHDGKWETIFVLIGPDGFVQTVRFTTRVHESIPLVALVRFGACEEHPTTGPFSRAFQFGPHVSCTTDRDAIVTRFAL